MVDLKVMAYFKISLSTRNWDRAFSKPWWNIRAFRIASSRPLPCFCDCPTRQAFLPVTTRATRGVVSQINTTWMEPTEGSVIWSPNQAEIIDTEQDLEEHVKRTQCL